MGIFRDLVANVAQAKGQEAQQKALHTADLGDSLMTLVRNEAAQPGDRAKALSLWRGLFSQHTGKQGKAMEGQIDALLTGYLMQQSMGARGGGTQGGVQPTPPGGTVAQQGPVNYPPGQGPGRPQAQLPQQPSPPGQRPGQPGGMNFGWPSGAATPATLTADQQQQQAAQQQIARNQALAGGSRGGGFLRGLAGVGGELLGIPRQQTYRNFPAEAFAPTARQQYKFNLDEDVKNKIITQTQADEELAEFDRLGGKAPSAARGAGRVPVSEQIYELALQAKAKSLNKPVDKLTAQESLDAYNESVRPQSEAKIADRDALQAYADKLTKQRGHQVRVNDLSAAEKIDARIDVKKQAASMGEIIDPADIEQMARYDLLTGKTTNFGMGASVNRSAYLRARAHILATEGPRSIAEQQAATRADSSSLNGLTRMTDAVQAWEANAKKNLEQARMLSRQVGRTGSTLANEYIQWSQGKLEEYPLLSRFRVAVETGAAEYTKVMYSATPTGGTAQDQRETSHSLLNTAMGEGNLNGAIEQMYIDMNNRRDTMNAQLDYIKGRIRTGEGGGAAAGGGAAGGGAAGAGGAGGGIPVITTKEQRDALPSGTRYKAPDGHIYQKQ